MFFAASLVQGFGGQMQQMANLWLIYSITGSALQLGLTGLARAVPSIVFTLIGGVIADRMERRRLIVFAQLGSGILALVLGTLAVLGLIEVWHIYAVTFLGGALGSVSQPAQRSVIAHLVPRHHLMNAMAMRFSLNQMNSIIGPSLGGVLIATFGAAVTYLFNGAALAVTAAMLIRIDMGEAPPPAANSAVASLIEGFAYVRKRSVILALLSVDSVTMFFGPYQVFLPIIAAQFGLGPQGYGLLASAPGVGAVLGSVTVMSLGNFPYKGILISAALLAYSVCLIGLALSPWFVVALVALASVGFADSMNATTRAATIQLLAPDEFRGRVSSIQQMLQGGIPSLGQGLMGGIATVVGVPAALIAGGLIGGACNLGILFANRELRSRELGMDLEPVGGSIRT